MLNFFKTAYKAKPKKVRFNVKIFIKLLEENEKVPEYYLTLANNINLMEDDTE